MKTGRRGFLGRALVAAAAVMGAGAAKTETVEASEGVGQLTPAACAQCGEIGATELMRRTHALYAHSGSLTTTGNVMVASNYISGTSSSGITVGGLRNEMLDHTDIVQGYIDRGEMIPPGTFIIARTLRVGSNTVVRGHGADTVLQGAPFMTDPVLQIGSGSKNVTVRDITISPGAAREAIFEAMQADARAEGYADGYTQATQRAEARVVLGKPISHEQAV